MECVKCNSAFSYTKTRLSPCDAVVSPYKSVPKLPSIYRTALNRGSLFIPIYVLYVTGRRSVSIAFCLNSTDDPRGKPNYLSKPRLFDESDLAGQGKGQGSGENGEARGVFDVR